MHNRDRLILAKTHLHPHAALVIAEFGHVQCGDEFARCQDRLSEPGKELVDRNHPSSDGLVRSKRYQFGDGSKSHKRTDGVVRRAGAREIAGDRGPVAKLRRTNLEARLCERQRRVHKSWIGDDLRVRDARSDSKD